MKSPAELAVELVQLFSNHQFNNLINNLDNLLDYYSGSCTLSDLLEFAHLSVEKLGDIICNYDISIDISPKYAPAYNNKGNAISILGETKEMLDCYSKTVLIEPNFAR